MGPSARGAADARMAGCLARGSLSTVRMISALFDATSRALTATAKTVTRAATTAAQATGVITPSAAAPAPVDTFSREAAAPGVAGGRGPQDPEAAAMAAAADLYARKGDTPYDLTKRSQVETLIRNSPQVDAATGQDPSNDGASRCATAATTAALLLTHDPARSAEAVKKTVAEYGLTPTAAQAAALEAMGQGTLTPNQSAQVQELLYDAVRVNGRQAAGGRQGMTGDDLMDLAATLKKHGAFRYAAVDLELRRVDDGKGGVGAHWTAQVETTRHGAVKVDTWPGADGRASVRPELPWYLQRHDSVLADGSTRSAPRDLLGEVSLWDVERDNGRVDAQYRRREVSAGDPTKVHEGFWGAVLDGHIPATRVAPDRTYSWP